MTIDQVITEIETIAIALGWRQLPNPYSLESNSNIFLSNGFGVTLGESTYDSLNGLEERLLSITLTSQNIGNAQSPVTIREKQTALTGGSSDIIKQLSSIVSSFSYVSDSGIEILGGEDGNEYLTITTIINVRLINRDLIAHC